MVKFMIELNADYTIKNHFGLTPFLLSAKLAKKEIFHFLFNIKRSKLLVYADIACGAFPLEDFDSIGVDGHTNEKSALHLVVNGVKLCVDFYLKIFLINIILIANVLIYFIHFEKKRL